MVSSFLRSPPGGVDIGVDAAARSRLPNSQKWILEKWILGLYAFRCSGNQMFELNYTSLHIFYRLPYVRLAALPLSVAAVERDIFDPLAGGGQPA